MDLEAGRPGSHLMSTLQELLSRLLQRENAPSEVAGEAAALVSAVLADVGAVRRAETLAERLRGQVGDFFERTSVFAPDDAELGPGRGAVPMTALLLAHAHVDAHWRRRGFSEEVRLSTAAEVARQILKTVRVTGRTGLDDAKWVEVVWRGGFAQLGRLQFELLREDDGSHLLSTHIPAGGPLDAETVRSSLRRARQGMEAAFPEASPLEKALCDSWLLDTQLPGLLPGSNVAAFSQLWEVASCSPGDDDVLYFVFDLPRGSGNRLAELLPGLEARSRMQVALLEHWRAGGHFQHCVGYVTLPQD